MSLIPDSSWLDSHAAKKPSDETLDPDSPLLKLVEDFRKAIPIITPEDRTLSSGLKLPVSVKS